VNSINKIIVLSTVAFLSSCSKIAKTDYTPTPTPVDPDIQLMFDRLKYGGQPGALNFNGVVINQDGNLDSRITMEQKIGNPSDNVELSKLSIPKFTSDIKRKDDYKPSSFGHYLNVGCDLEGDPRIEGLTALKNKPNEFGLTDTFGVAASMADKVFLCGKIEIKEISVIINTNEIYLSDVELLKENQIGFITMISDLLSIEGKNLILTTGVSDRYPSLMPASSVDLTIYEKVVGAGQLEVKSFGGDKKDSE
jgi:hypothetical protein